MTGERRCNGEEYFIDLAGQSSLVVFYQSIPGPVLAFIFHLLPSPRPFLFIFFFILVFIFKYNAHLYFNIFYLFISLTIQIRTGVLVQKLKCLLPNDVSLANLNLSGSVVQ